MDVLGKQLTSFGFVLAGLITILTQWKTIAKLLRATLDFDFEAIGRLLWLLVTFIAIVLGTFVAPSWVLIPALMAISSHLIPPEVTDMQVFATRLTLLTAMLSQFYPLIWGIFVYPFITAFISRGGEE